MQTHKGICDWNICRVIVGWLVNLIISHLNEGAKHGNNVKRKGQPTYHVNKALPLPFSFIVKQVQNDCRSLFNINHVSQSREQKKKTVYCCISRQTREID